MMASGHAVLRADATWETGGGHVSRILAIGNELLRQNWACTLLTSAESRTVFPSLQAFKGSILEIPEEALVDAKGIQALIDNMTVFVADATSSDLALETSLQEAGVRLVLISDAPDRQFLCDIMVDPGPGSRAKDYSHLIPENSLRLVGMGYQIFNQQFSKAWQARTKRSNAPSDGIWRVLINFGSVDGKGMALKALRAITLVPGDWVIDVVSGPESKQHAALLQTSRECRFSVKVHNWIEDMPGAIAASHLGIGAGGVSALERCLLGLPSLVIETAQDQRGNIEALVTSNAAKYVGHFSSVTEEQIAQSIIQLREECSAQAAPLEAVDVIDPLGPLWVASAISAPFSRAGEAVWLRPALPNDLNLTYSWQCAAETRRFFRCQDAPSEEEHRIWFNRTRTDRTKVFMIIMANNRACGVLRLEPMTESDSLEVSILIAPGEKRQGLGGHALELAQQHFPDFALIAFVDEKNASSRALFESKGFNFNGQHYSFRSKQRYRIPNAEPRNDHC